MVKKGPPRSLSVVVDPSHKLIVDDTDRPRTGRLILDGGVGGGSNTSTGSVAHPAVPALGASFNINRPRTEVSGKGSTGSQPPPVAVVGDDHDTNVPPSHPVLATHHHDSMTCETPLEATFPSLKPPSLKVQLPPTPSFASTLAARRRSSVVTLPHIPAAQPPTPPPAAAAAAPSLRLRTSTHSRTNSGNSLNSISQQQNQSRPPSVTRRGGGEDSGRFTYMNTAAVLSHSTLNSITMPAPYRNGPVQVLPGIWLGCEDNARDFEGLRRCGIGSVLNVAKEIVDLFGDAKAPSPTLAPPHRVRSTMSTPNLGQTQSTPKSRLTAGGATFHPADAASGRPDLHYLHLPWSHGQSDLVENGFAEAFQFCDQAIQRGKGVLVHCQCGVSRSATLVIALVMRAASKPDATDELRSLGPSMHAAYDYVKQKSSCVGPNMSLIYQLMDYEKQLQPRAIVSRTNSYQDQSVSEVSSQSEPGNSPDEPYQYMSEEERIRSEEEEWANMRRQLEEEEEREREESLRAAGAGPLSRSDAITTTSDSSAGGASNDDDVGLAVPWNQTWTGFSMMQSRPSTRSVADDEEAKGLDRAMEERLLRRKSSALSVASSGVSSGGGGLGPTSGVPGPSSTSGGAPTPHAAWKARFGHARRTRAGSMESNITGRSISMISVEEEDEGGLEAEGEGEGEDSQARFGAEHSRTTSPDSEDGRRGGRRLQGLLLRPRPFSTLSTDSRSFLESGTDSASVSEASPSEAGSPNVDDDSSEQYLTAPPLSANATASSAPVTTPITPLSIPSRKKNNGGKFKPVLDIAGAVDVETRGSDDFRSFRIVVEEPTPLATRISSSVASFTYDDTPASPTPMRPRPPPTRSMTSPSGHPFAPLNVHRVNSMPPPSASAFKTSFGADDFSAPPPPPSASHLKMSFGSDTTIPFPRRMSPSSSVSESSSGASPRSKPRLHLPLVQRRLSKRMEPALQTVPSSPPAVGYGADVISENLMDALTSSTPPRYAEHSLASPIVAGPSRTFFASPPSLPATTRVAAAPFTEPLVQQPVEGGRKRIKSKPTPLSFTPNQDGPAPASLASYVLSSSKTGHRSKKSISSASSVSSRSSSTSTTSLRNKLLARVTGGFSPTPPSPGLPTATPHQTLFIFPPSPTSHQTTHDTTTLPSATPSAFMLTTNFISGDGTSSSSSSSSSSPSQPLLTPTPTLATFMATSRRAAAALSRKSSMSSTTSSRSGWLGAVPSTPTTACSRVDARGWLAR